MVLMMFLKIKMIKLLQNKKGFSLIELMVVVVILGLMVLGLVTFFTGGARSWVSGQSQLQAQREARQAMDIMVREIREGKNVISGSDTTITVSIPSLGGNPAYDVTFALSGTTIQRKKNSTSNPLIDNVLKVSGESIFKYYNSSGIEINPPDNTVSKIQIYLKVDVDNDKNPDITLNTDASLRNYGF
jgi:prepilin-type N-terminal cleavage/methylation domain-containing protein